MFTDKEVSLLPPGVLAYIGDSVFELLVRKYILDTGLRKLQDIHQKAISLVNATSQAELLREIEGFLTEEEKNIVRRGKNTNTGSVPKNAEIIDYRLSTGLEALFGYLYLCKRQERLEEIWQKIMERGKGN